MLLDPFFDKTIEIILQSSHCDLYSTISSIVINKIIFFYTVSPNITQLVIAYKDYNGLGLNNNFCINFKTRKVR